MKEISLNYLIENMVSIMIPCYNGEMFVERLFKNIARQTYKNIQVVFVNDGSTDKTEERVFQYYDILEAEGIELRYIKKENGGAASAINAALSAVKGEYCMWFDADDRMSFDHVEKKYLYLKGHPDKDLVMCTAYIYDEFDINMERSIGTLGEQPAVDSLFEDVLLERRNCSSGLYMTRTKVLLDRLGYREIEESSIGQNMQLLLPLVLKGNIGYIPDKLFMYTYRKNSHSHLKTGIKDQLERLKNIDILKKNVIERLNLPAEYKEKLFDKLNKYLKYQQMGYWDSVLDMNVDMAKKIWVDFFTESKIKENRENRKIFCWGKCRVSYNIVRAFEVFEGIECGGIIESDLLKCNREDNVFYKEYIDCEKMYLIIPLKYYVNIIDTLEKYNLKKDRDYYYPMALLVDKDSKL